MTYLTAPVGVGVGSEKHSISALIHENERFSLRRFLNLLLTMGVYLP